MHKNIILAFVGIRKHSHVQFLKCKQVFKKQRYE